MSADRLLIEQFDIWTGAVTYGAGNTRSNNGEPELTGIEQLRELILALAVRGKLVPQNPEEEPASKLLEWIEGEKARLYKQGQIKKPNKLPDIGEDQKPFELPASWAWFRLGSLLAFEYGNSLPKKNRVESGNVDVYGSNGVVGKHDEEMVSGPCIVIGRKGSAGAINIANGPAWVTDVAFYVVPPEGIDLKFAYLLLSSLKLEELGKGIKPGVNRNEAYHLVAALPPQNEQQRIVEKVDELMALCDRLEQQTSDQISAHETLVDTLLDTLTRSQDADELADNWARVAGHFDTLFTTYHSIDRLEQAIYQLAVMARLVPQDPNAESASRLLERLTSHHGESRGSSRHSRNGPIEPVTEEEKPFDIPKQWEWVRVGECLTVKRGASPRPKGDPRYFAQGRTAFHWVKIGDVRKHGDGKTLLDTEEFLTEEGAKKSVFVPKGTLVITNSATIGVPIMMGIDGYIHDGFLSFPNFPHEHIDVDYFLIALRALTPYLMSEARGMAQLNMNSQIMKAAPLALPPFEEQRRIKERVHELIGLCDRFRGALGAKGELMVRMSEAMVTNVSAGDERATEDAI